MGGRVSMNRLTLAFEDREVERAYRDDRTGRRSPRQFVASLLVAIALWLVLAITANLLLPVTFVWFPLVIAVSSQSIAVALAKVLPLATFRRIAARMVCVLALLAGLAYAFWVPSITEPVVLLTFAGAGIYLLCVHGFMDLRFSEATFWLLFAQALGMRTSYVDERLRRRVFLQQRTIEEERRRADDLQRESARKEVTLLNGELRRQIAERSPRSSSDRWTRAPRAGPRRPSGLRRSRAEASRRAQSFPQPAPSAAAS